MRRFPILGLVPLAALLLSGCPGSDATGPQGTGSFSITVPSTIQISQGGSGAIDVEVQASGGFDENVELTLHGHGGMTPAYSNLTSPQVGRRIELLAPIASAPGEVDVTIRASADGYPDQTAVVKVVIVSSVVQVVITPKLPQVPYDGTLEVEATALGGVGEVVSLTGRTVHWRPFTEGVVDVQGNGDHATLTGIGEGMAFVFAEVGGVEGSELVTVGRAPVATVEITAPSTNLAVFETMEVYAVAKNSRGAALTNRPYSWTSSNPDVASIRDDGFGQATITGLQPGTATITVESEGKTDTIVIVVGAEITITLSPQNAQIEVGKSGYFDVEVAGTSDDRLDWSSGNSGVASVASDGRVTGISVGTTTITARLVADPSIFATATLNVKAPATGGGTPPPPTEPPTDPTEPSGPPTTNAQCEAYWRPILVDGGPDWWLGELIWEGERHYAQDDYADQNFMRFSTDGENRWTYEFMTGSVRQYNENSAYTIAYDPDYLSGVPCVLNYYNQLGSPDKLALSSYEGGELLLQWASDDGQAFADWYWRPE